VLLDGNNSIDCLAMVRVFVPPQEWKCGGMGLNGQDAQQNGWTNGMQCMLRDFNRTTNPTAKTMQVTWRNHNTENSQLII
jgi:hypothetical protein